MTTAKSTRARSTGTRKTGTRSKTASKAASSDAAAPDTIQTIETGTAPDVTVLPLPEGGGVTMKKKELIDLVVARSGIRKRDAKPVIEAALAILGDALAEGRELNLQPLGKLKVTRMKKGGNGQIINARVRQPEESAPAAPKPEIEGDDPLAQAAE